MRITYLNQAGYILAHSLGGNYLWEYSPRVVAWL